MKVLAVSLLRLGDILMLAPVLRGLKDQGKDVELHVLVNKQFLFVKDLMPWVDKFIGFDRQELQRGLGEPDRQIFEPLDRLNSIVSFLDREKYDKVINLTHNRFSGFLCGMIKANDKLGLTINQLKSVSFGNRWYSYMNEQVAGGASFTAHMMDIHYYGSGLPYREHRFDFKLNTEGEEEAQALLKNLDPFICVQPLTSDEKKNWEIEQFVDALKIFNFLNPNFSIYCLGAPNEGEKIAEFITACKAEGIQVYPAICSLQGALGLLTQSRLLLTGDTSIKHLASGTDCKIIEVSIGSSDYQKTGIYKPNSYIITSQASCAPCSHSSKCSQPSHICGENVDAEAVGLIMNQVLNGGDKEIRIIAREYNDKLRVYKTFFNHSGFWYARDLSKGFDSTNLEQVVNLSSWKLLNQGEHLKLIGEYGSECVKLNAAIQQAFPEVQNKIKQSFFSDLELRVVKGGENLKLVKECLQNLLKKKTLNSNDIQRNYKLLCEELSPKLADEILFFTKNYDGNAVQNFNQLRKYSEAMQSAFNRNQIQLKLIRTMMNQRMAGL